MQPDSGFIQPDGIYSLIEINQERYSGARLEDLYTNLSVQAREKRSIIERLDRFKVRDSRRLRIWINDSNPELIKRGGSLKLRNPAVKLNKSKLGIKLGDGSLKLRNPSYEQNFRCQIISWWEIIGKVWGKFLKKSLVKNGMEKKIL